MADPVLFRRVRLSQRLTEIRRDEDRVVAEPAPPRPSGRDRTAAVASKRAEDPPSGGQRHDADEPAAPAGRGNAAEQTEEFFEVGPIHLVFSCEAGGADAGAAAERLDLQAGVFGQHRQDRVTRSLDRFFHRVGQERGAVFAHRRDAGEAVERDQPDRNPFQQAAELPDLVAVPGGEQKRQRGIPFKAPRWASMSRSMPFLASASIWSIWACVKVPPSPVPCTSTNCPFPVITTFMSTSALESSS